VTIQVITVPDLGGADAVDVIEVCVAPGDVVEVEQSLVVLETDKASMEIPSTHAGTIVSVKVNEGDSISEGSALVELEIEAAEQAAPAADIPEPVVEAPSAIAPAASEPAAAASAEQTVTVPDVGTDEDVDVIEICVAVGDTVSEGDSLIVLETDKASIEIPAPAGGKVLSLSINEGDKIASGAAIAVLLVEGSAPAPESSAPVAQAEAPAAPQPKAAAPAAPAAKTAPSNETTAESDDGAYAGPAVRKLARQMGVDLSKVKGGGPRGRLTKDDIRAYVTKAVDLATSGKVTGGSGIPAIPAVDFAKFGDVELVKMTKIQKITANNMSRNWLNVPHVTQFDDADITELETFRKGMKAEAEKRGVKLTPLPFLLKACAAALRYEPAFNVSMHSDGEHIVKKDYVNIGIAVATPAGLMVPVIRDVDKKGLWELAEESNAMAKKARDGKLMPMDMQGGCFSISSLGAMGGTGFTPIVNAPEVAILGVSKADIKPKWDGQEFQPRNMLPLCLSYDHRAINGADAGNFMTFLVSAIGDIRRLLL